MGRHSPVSALLVRGLHRAYNFDPGFDYTRVITVDPQLYAHGYEPARAAQFMRELQSRMRHCRQWMPFLW